MLWRYLHESDSKQQHFTVFEMAADWHELMLLQSVVQISIAHTNEQLDLRCN